MWGLVHDRGGIFGSARQEIDIQAEEGMEQLIPTVAFKQTVPYSSRVGKNKEIYKGIFGAIAMKNDCSLNWLEDGLQILADDRHKLQETYQLLLPAIILLEGTSINIYWVDGLLGLQFRFTKLARAVDQSVYRMKGFSATHYDLHLVYWETRSCQFLTLRPKSISQIEFNKQVRNPWHKHIDFQYRIAENAPSEWMDVEILSVNLASGFMPPEKLSNIRSWAKEINDNTIEEGGKIAEVSNSVPTSKEPGKGRVSLFAKGKRVEKKDIDSLAEQNTRNSTGRRAFFLDDAELDRPRANPAPRLLAESQIKSVEEVMNSMPSKEYRPNFMDLLVHTVAKLITTIKLYMRNESSCVINLGQIFISSVGIPDEHQPRRRRTAAPFKPEDWHTIFGQDGKPSPAGKTFFSRKLTSSNEDALFMSLTQLKPVKRPKGPETVFQPKPCSDITFFRIRCQNVVTGTVGVIEIDHKKNISIKAESREIGFANIHFSAFWWDARVSTCITRGLSTPDVAAFDQLLSTIWIGNVGTQTDQGVRIFARLHPDMRILSCQRRRERIHCTTEDLPHTRSIYLHITRIEDLNMANITTTPGGFCAFPAPAKPPPPPTAAPSGPINEIIHHRDQKIWYEAHIHSESINSVLPGSSDPSAYPPGLPGPDHTFTAPENNLVLRDFLFEELRNVFNATHSLVTEWDPVGSRDRMTAFSRARAEEGAGAGVGVAGPSGAGTTGKGKGAGRA